MHGAIHISSRCSRTTMFGNVQPRLHSMSRGVCPAIITGQLFCQTNRGSNESRLAPESPLRHSDRRRRQTAEIGRSLTIKPQKSHQVATKRDRPCLGCPDLGSQCRLAAASILRVTLCTTPCSSTTTPGPGQQRDLVAGEPPHASGGQSLVRFPAAPRSCLGRTTTWWRSTANGGDARPHCGRQPSP